MVLLLGSKSVIITSSFQILEKFDILKVLGPNRVENCGKQGNLHVNLKC
jgi:hypothetical protein